MVNTVINSNSNIAVSKMLQLISLHSGSVNVPVKGGLVLPYVNGAQGLKSSEAISVPRAIELNSIIAKLVKSPTNQLSQMYKDYLAGKIEQSDLMKAIKAYTVSQNTNKFAETVYSTKGLVVNTTA